MAKNSNTTNGKRPSQGIRALLALGMAVLVLAAGCTDDTDAPRESASFSVVTLNIWHNRADWPQRLEVIVEGLREVDPDAICLQEVLQHEDLPNQAQTLAERLGYHVYFSSTDPEDGPKRYGNALLTRDSMATTHWTALEPTSDYRTAAHARVSLGGQPVDLYCTHLHHTQEGDSIRARQVRDLLAFVDSTRSAAPVILAGDFNAAPQAPSMQQLTQAGYVDVYGTLHPDTAVTTLNVDVGHTPRRIDHLFLSAEAPFEPTEASILFQHPMADSVWASDHFGVYGRFTLD